MASARALRPTTWYKDPDEVLDYMLEWAARFNDTEEVVSSAL